MIIVFILPVLSTYWLKIKLGGEIYFTVSLNLIVMMALSTFTDLVILDWLIVSKITPRFVILPGTEKEHYKKLSENYIGHAKTVPILIILCVILGLVIHLS